ncbi:MAG TPA: hypothetical protein DEA22_14705 [Blastocatellia bacterium]|nr:hypothetical protein [Blastocatellia bacterium]
MPRDDKFRLLRDKAGNTCRNIIAGGMGVNNFDIIFTDEIGYLNCAQYTEGIAYRDMENFFGLEKIKPPLPFICRPKRNKNLVSALMESAAKVSQMTFSPAKNPL